MSVLGLIKSFPISEVCNGTVSLVKRHWDVYSLVELRKDCKFP
jgi:hypothetical protein